ncbi:MAG TPA: hypothetical protein VG297_00440 [Bryobacteraceae bacterium]|nr:hypothetical protein [Bryobacteraceae bacterium]
MKAAISVLVLLAAFPIALAAQWPDYPTPNVPKTADGKPNLDGPAPRTADGHPDLSGVWENRRGFGAGRGAAGRGGGPGRAGGPPPAGAPQGPPPPPPPPPLPADGIPNATFGNIGAGFKDGLPLKPAAAELLKKRKAENSKDNPDAHCLPLGLMQLHLHPQPRKIIQSPAVTTILYEAQAGVRQIFTDGRPLPPKDVQPWWYGYSIGHWDGDTLVVETTGFRDDVWLDVNGSPLTNAGKMIEKFRRPNFGHLEIEVTIDDPSQYTKPFTVKVNQQIMLNTDLIEFICSENERSDAHLIGK